MTTEEKAKAYDKLFVKASRIYNKENDVLILHTIEDLFPGLKESGGERIRKALISFLKSPFVNENITDEKVTPWIVWLEKQEQKPQGKSALEAAKEEKVDNQNCVKQPTDEEMKTLLRTEYEKGRADAIVEMQKPAWSEEDEVKKNRIVCVLENLNITDNDILHKDVDWLKSLKDRVQPKQELSKEDEVTRKKIIKFLKEQNYFDGKANEFKEPYKKEYEWLKSLRPQNRWKPSDLPHWKKSTLPNDNTTGFNSDYFCYKGYNINYKELFEKLPKDD